VGHLSVPRLRVKTLLRSLDSTVVTHDDEATNEMIGKSHVGSARLLSRPLCSGIKVQLSSSRPIMASRGA